MVSVVFADTVNNAKARQTSTMTPMILPSPCGNRETMRASSAYSIPHTAPDERSQSIGMKDCFSLTADGP